MFKIVSKILIKFINKNACHQPLFLTQLEDEYIMETIELKLSYLCIFLALKFYKVVNLHQIKTVNFNQF